MSKDTFGLVRESWRRSRRNGVVMGELFRLNLRRINPTLAPMKSKTKMDILDLLLLQAFDDVVNRLDEKQELVYALRNFCCLFKLSDDRRKEMEHISEAIFLTIEQVIDDYSTSHPYEEKNLIRERFNGAELNTEKNCGSSGVPKILPH